MPLVENNWGQIIGVRVKKELGSESSARAGFSPLWHLTLTPDFPDPRFSRLAEPGRRIFIEENASHTKLPIRAVDEAYVWVNCVHYLYVLHFRGNAVLP
jgi:hypothetical protein